ncbi:MAG: hypothetical protein ACRDHL_12595, partial [Candidatus Promineifilaceae bacterium]
QRLAAGDWRSPEQLQEAIAAEQAYIGSLSAGRAIQLAGGPPRASAGGRLQVRSGLDDLADAVDYLFGVQGAPTPEPGLRRADMVYMALTGDHEWRGVYHPERVRLAGADTAALAGLAANAMNKVVAQTLASLTHYRWYEAVVKVTANDGSLHDMQWISVGGLSNLPLVPEGAAYDELSLDDAQETDAWATYGGYVGITRKMLKNSDIQRIQAVPRALAAAAVKTRSAKIAALFTANGGIGPTLDQDAAALFHASHNNLQTTALGSDLTAWRTAAVECFKQTEINSGDRIGVMPKYLLVPIDLYHQALVNFGYGEGMPTTYLPEALAALPLGDPRPVPLAVPDWSDANDWAYIADPAVWPVIHMSFSQEPAGRGFPAPEIFAATAETGGLLFASDTLPIKVRDEFVYGVSGYRGIGKRNVA